MPISSFAEKEHQPTMNEVFATVGSKRGLWEKLTRFVSDNFGINQGDFRFYGKNYGWALRFRKAGKALISLYPGKEGFTAQIIIGRNEAEKAFNLTLGKNARKTLEDSREFHEGRWLFIRVESDQDAGDVQQLLIVKSRPAKKQI
jgi:hypothetical protein